MDKVIFDKLYYQCFDKNDKIMFCGRQHCKELLQFLNDSKYGNIDTGMLNVENIVALHKSMQ